MFRRSLLLSCAAAVGSNGVTIDGVAVSDRCADRIAAVNQVEKWVPTRPLRLQVVTGGCQGFSYEFHFDEKGFNPDKDVEIFSPNTPRRNTDTSSSDEASTQERRLIVDWAKTLPKLKGATVDYHMELKGAAFRVMGNEVVDQACACGQSFSMIQAMKAEQAIKKEKEARGETLAKPAPVAPPSYAGNGGGLSATTSSGGQGTKIPLSALFKKKAKA